MVCLATLRPVPVGAEAFSLQGARQALQEAAASRLERHWQPPQGRPSPCLGADVPLVTGTHCPPGGPGCSPPSEAPGAREADSPLLAHLTGQKPKPGTAAGPRSHKAGTWIPCGVFRQITIPPALLPLVGGLGQGQLRPLGCWTAGSGGLPHLPRDSASLDTPPFPHSVHSLLRQSRREPSPGPQRPPCRPRSSRFLRSACVRERPRHLGASPTAATGSPHAVSDPPSASVSSPLVEEPGNASL